MRLTSSKAVGCLATTAVIFILVLSIYPIKFNANDDLAMMLTSNGFLAGGSPSEYLVYISVYLGLLFKMLYTLHPDVPWYSLALYLTQFAATGIIALVFLGKSNRALQVLGVFVLAMFSFRFITSPTFTTTAFLAAIAAITLLIEYLRNPSLGFPVLILAGVLCILSWLWRPLALQGVLLLSLPWVAYQWRKLLNPQLVGFTLLLCPILWGLSAGHKNYYETNPEWSTYLEYNKVRGALHGYPLVNYKDELELEAFEKIGWSSNDFKMFRKWFFIDEKVYSHKNLEQLLEVVPSNARHEMGLGKFFRTFSTPRNLALPAAFICLVLLYTAFWEKRSRQVFIYAGWSLCIMIFMAFFMRLPERVFLPIVLLSLIMFINALDDEVEIERGPQKYSVFLFMLLPLLFLSFQLGSTYWKSSKIESRKIEFVTMLENLQAIDRKGLFLNWGGSIPFRFTDPFITLGGMPKVNILGLGWRTHSPHFNEQLRQLKIDNLEREMVANPHIYLVASPENHQLFESYYEHKYQVDVHAEQISDHPAFGVLTYRYTKLSAP